MKEKKKKTCYLVATKKIKATTKGFSEREEKKKKV